ncbi:Bcr/CflA family efflux MFS transporter [Sutterella wadsworthensis]|uniref:Bcr/CflA family efflux MFS transporter n=1 Tax=Sutterella wadsworthensis TaxID=40545 RepID=UPI00396769F3
MTTSSNSRVFLLLFLATLAAFGPFVTDFYLPTLPEQTTDFHTSPAMVQLGLSNIMWGLAAGQLLVGPISDRRGRKKPLFWCLVLFAVTTAVAAAATEIHVFLVMRFFEGLGAAGAIVLSRSIAADRYTGRELGSFMGVMGAIQGIAPITAPMLGALIADAAGWRGIFWILFGTGVVLAFITLFVFVETLPRSRINSAERSSNGTQRESIRESSAKLIADPVFCGIVFQQLLASGILFGHISSSPFIFRGHFDLSPELYGLTFGLLALGITAGAVISSRIDPLKALGVGAVGMLVCAVFVAVCFITNLSLWAVLPFYFLLMAFLGLTLPAAMTAALTLHRQRAGFAAAVIGSVRS